MDDELLANLIAAVEQQLLSPQTRYVNQAHQRLLKLGLPDAEAKSQIALCLGEEMDNILRTKRPFDEKAYREALTQLPFPDDEGEPEDPDEETTESPEPGTSP